MGSIALVRWGVLIALALAVAGWDLTQRIIPNAVAAAGLGVGLALASISGWPAFRAGLLGAAVLGGPMIALWSAGAVGGGDGFVGAGDAKAALALGAVLGMPNALAGLWWGAAAGGLLAIGVIASGLWQARNAMVTAIRGGGIRGLLAMIVTDPVWGRGIPYGAALAAGALVAEALNRV